GKAVIQLDADLQHPPEVLDEFVTLWQNGNDIVYGKRASRAHEGLIRRVLAKSFYKVFGIISHVKLMEGLGDFVLLDRKVVNALLSLPERERFTKGLYAWVGFQRASVTFEIGKRVAGRSGFNLRRLMHFAMDAITGFGSVPLKVWSFVGLAMAISAMALGGYFILEKILWGSNVPGYPSLMAAICFFAGVQLIGLGIVGEYLSRVLMEVKQRPLYLVQEHVGFEEPATKDDGPATIRRVAV
ncbi:MAG: glycosyltransferase, partial [Pseudomonadota bacterium]